jgi:hypothetical protein
VAVFVAGGFVVVETTDFVGGALLDVWKTKKYSTNAIKINNIATTITNIIVLLFFGELLSMGVSGAITETNGPD